MEQTLNKTQDIKQTQILIGLLMAGFIGLFGETALNIALSQLMKDFSITPGKVQWLSTSYILVIGILAPLSGLLLRWVSTRKILLSSILIFITGTIICASAPYFSVLLIGRVVQGIATGILIPLIFNTILIIYPPEKRGTAMGFVGLVISFAPVIGPTISGFLLSSLSWRWIFIVMLPFLVIAFIVSALYMKNITTVTRPKIDILSVLLSIVGFGSVVFGFSSAGDKGWGSLEVVVTLAIGIISLAFFTHRQLTMEVPILNLRVFKYRMFSLGVLMIVLSFGMIMGVMLVLPLYFLDGLLLPAAAVGLYLLPSGLANGVFSAIAGRLFDSFGAKWLVKIGATISVLAMTMLILSTKDSSVGYIITATILFMIGVPLTMSPAQTNALNQLPHEVAPDGTAIMNTLQQIAGAISIALTMVFLTVGKNTYLATGGTDATLAMVNGAHYVFIFTLVLALIVFTLSMFINTKAYGK
ncbi:MDR family MFS transporter [Brochothrix thermosphacta]|uniref:MDR family MFS transporter n=1 Tax=Brochothrix thermosphacta TaxID=2756 RepID=UPI0027142ED2|nr:MDR family MFS transporter [Brochothrix thermosphacta]MDO7864296.1 MDR family MFS transporter [Brochothrix thermosphacta]